MHRQALTKFMIKSAYEIVNSTINLIYSYLF